MGLPIPSKNLLDPLFHFATNWQKSEAFTTLPIIAQTYQKNNLQKFRKSTDLSDLKEFFRYFPLKNFFDHASQAFNQLVTQRFPNETLTTKIEGYHIKINYQADRILLPHDLVLPHGMTLTTFQTLWKENNSEELNNLLMRAKAPTYTFNCLREAAFLDGLFLKIDKHVVLSKPLILHHHYTAVQPSMPIFKKLYYIAEAGKCMLYETHITDRSSQPFCIHEDLFLATQSSLKQHTWLSQLHVAANCLENQSVYLAEASSYQCASLWHINQLYRNEKMVYLQGKEAHCQLLGGYQLKGKGKADHQLTIVHETPNCQSSQNYKGLGLDEGKGSFTGKIQIIKNAQKSSAHQIHHGWIVGPKAGFKVSPQLQIWADDVACTHGATLAPPPQPLLFYAASRGLTAKEALDLYLHDFFSSQFLVDSEKGWIDFVLNQLKKAMH